MNVRTLNDLFFRASHEHDKTDAFRVRTAGAYHAVSHREALKLVEELSLGLVSLGIRPGDRVAVFSENRLEWALADYAILAAGAVNVPIYPTLPAGQAGFILKDCGASVVFVSPGMHLQKIEEIRDHLDPGLRIVAFEPAGWVPPPVDVSGAWGTLVDAPVRPSHAPVNTGRPWLMTWDELRTLGVERARQDPHAHRSRADLVRSSDPASLIYTSGTTGEPKGVVLTHGNIVSNVLAALSVFPINAHDSCLSFLPLSHIFERMAGHFTMFCAGATIAYAESMETVPLNLLEVRPSVLISVPRLYEKMHARVMETVAASPAPLRALFHWAVGVGRKRSQFLLAGAPVPRSVTLSYRIAMELVLRKIRERLGGRIRFMVSGGAALAPELVRFFHAAGLPILEGYGLTETSPVIACNRLDALKPGTVGQPIPGVEVRIAWDGEILVRGPGVMKEYYKRPAETVAALEGGWFHTGDIGALDHDGFLSITDRKKDLIVTAGGKKVAPQPIENRLRQDPYIADAVLLGDGHPYVVALVVPEFSQLEGWARKQGLDGDATALCRNERVQSFMTNRVLGVNAGLASFEQIKKVALVDRMPSVDAGDLTPSLKIRRKVFLNRHQSLIDALYAGHVPPVSPEPGPIRTAGGPP
jgi:long-chain acyl-CoA synthetase